MNRTEWVGMAYDLSIRQNGETASLPIARSGLVRIFLILRLDGVSTSVVPMLLRAFAPRANLSDIPSLCLTRPLRKACSCSVRVPQRWQRNQRSHYEYRRVCELIVSPEQNQQQ